MSDAPMTQAELLATIEQLVDLAPSVRQKFKLLALVAILADHLETAKNMIDEAMKEPK